MNHRPDLYIGMLEPVLTVYKRLSDTKLLERCMRVATQNANECLNGEIWRRCPKTQWLSRTNIMIGEHNSMHINLTLCKCFTY